MTFYKCEHCGNIIAYIHDSGVRAQCCGEEMKLLLPNTTDAAGEKHVPVIKIDGQIVTVSVGAVEHPMLDAHYIECGYETMIEKLRGLGADISRVETPDKEAGRSAG